MTRTLFVKFCRFCMTGATSGGDVPYAAYEYLIRYRSIVATYKRGNVHEAHKAANSLILFMCREFAFPNNYTVIFTPDDVQKLVDRLMYVIA